MATQQNTGNDRVPNTAAGGNNLKANYTATKYGTTMGQSPLVKFIRMQTLHLMSCYRHQMVNTLCPWIKMDRDQVGLLSWVLDVFKLKLEVTERNLMIL